MLKHRLLHYGAIRWVVIKLVLRSGFFGLICLSLSAITSCHKETDIELTVDFSYKILNNNYTVPISVEFINSSKGAQNYSWEFEGGNPSTYSSKEPGTITFNKTGKIKVRLEAWNSNTRGFKEVEFQVDSVVKAKFEVVPILNLISPVEINLNNISEGSSTYKWYFSGGNPVTSSDKNPSGIKYTLPGEYLIRLESSNERGVSDTISQKFIVRPPLSAGFDIEPSFEDDDYEAPLTAVLHNTSISATTHLWSAPGGSVSNSVDSLPTVFYNNSGTYSITYMGSNGKQTQTVLKSIVVRPNTHLRTFTNVRFGINSAYNTYGSYFSTKLRKGLLLSEINNTNSNQIDIVYFGLNDSFTFNRFISPDSTSSWTYPAIPGATHSIFVNRQDLCNCNINISATDFDNLIDGLVMNGYNIVETPSGISSFDNSVLPRVVAFKNANGKKGLIKIKQLVNAGVNSYIICDIKVQKD